MKRRFYEHSSILPVGSGAHGSTTPRSRTTREIAALVRRLKMAGTEDSKRLAAQLDDAMRLRKQAEMFEMLEVVCAMLARMRDSFPGPLQRAVMDGEEVPLAALDAEVTKMIEARQRTVEQPSFPHGTMYRKTTMAQSRIAVLAQKKLAR